MSSVVPSCPGLRQAASTVRSSLRQHRMARVWARTSESLCPQLLLIRRRTARGLSHRPAACYCRLRRHRPRRRRCSCWRAPTARWSQTPFTCSLQQQLLVAPTTTLRRRHGRWPDDAGARISSRARSERGRTPPRWSIRRPAVRGVTFVFRVFLAL